MASPTAQQVNSPAVRETRGEGNGSPLQCSCLENPWDGGAWWAAVYGVTQSQTRLKRRSSSSRRHKRHRFNPRVRKIPWSRKCQPTAAFLPEKLQRQRGLEGCSPWGHTESDVAERLSARSDRGLALQRNVRLRSAGTPVFRNAQLCEGEAPAGVMK